MEKTIRGKAYVVEDSVDTDQIIPAEHLVYSLTEPDERKLYGQYALSGVPKDKQGLPNGGTPFTAEGSYTSEFSVIVAGSNFGCGSSREHAPFAIKEAGCAVVVAGSFARIFYRNSIDGGFLTPLESMEVINDRVSTGDDVEVDIGSGTLTNHTTGDQFLLKPLGDVAGILEAGNVFEYARRAGMVAK